MRPAKEFNKQKPSQVICETDKSDWPFQVEAAPVSVARGFVVVVVVVVRAVALLVVLLMVLG